MLVIYNIFAQKKSQPFCSDFFLVRKPKIRDNRLIDEVLLFILSSDCPLPTAFAVTFSKGRRLETFRLNQTLLLAPHQALRASFPRNLPFRPEISPSVWGSLSFCALIMRLPSPIGEGKRISIFV